MSEQISSILVVDDEMHIRRLLQYNLSKMGFKIYIAENGLIGLQMARDKKPDLILLDYMMPEMDGLQVLAEAKLDANIKNIPIFMLTAKGMKSDVETAFELGANDYIVKPFELEKFKNKLKKFLKQQSI